MADIRLIPYSSEFEGKWDSFVLNYSANGTMLQTRKFLSYHSQDRFVDNSLVIMKGTELIGVIPANLIETSEGKKLYSHQGSTFGGVILGKNNIKVSVLENVFIGLDNYCIENKIYEISLKMTSALYSKNSSELLNYYLFNHGYTCNLEVGYFIDFNKYNDDIPSNFSPSVRRHYKSAKKNGLFFRELKNRKEIKMFYDVLLDNYKKFGTQPAHSLNDLYLLKYDILKDRIRFFGVFKGDDAVASSMVFDFDHKVFHTQYLASRLAYSNLYVNEYLYTNLISCAKDNKFAFFSLGTATLEGGAKINYNLAQYKEQYGTDQYVNQTYHKMFER